MEIARKRKWIEFDGSIQQQHQHQLTCVDTDEEDDDCELLLKEESKQKIYIQMQSCITFMCFRWFIADISSNLLEEANDMMNSMPNILQNTQGYATALLKSKLFFLGGEIWDKLNPKHYMLSIENVRKTVFAFDVVTQTWDDPSEYPNLLSPRLFGRAEAVDDKIFVFGSYNNDLLLKHEQHYAEYLDLSSSKEKRMWRTIFLNTRLTPPKRFLNACPKNSGRLRNRFLIASLTLTPLQNSILT
ncbi:hypothetical protein FRX31_004521 [Thalictrum thalictroides]|uniref:Galactose oxidase/kelch repeat superfamily protein n=1 Tax=Thalictrum thalictroides TaxID=46969 RepID=A0A7J6XBY6_THATH|nr:hypothetical protein FRX31_004521 [Thalictrum thalictroides]